MLLAELIALGVYAPGVVLVHELGHAAFARWGGYRVTSFGIGLGRPVFSIYLRSGVVLHLDRWLLAGGACTAIPVGPVTRRRIAFHAGGLWAQGLLALVLWALPSAWPLDRVAQFNLLVAITNAVPWRVGAHASDGWAVWDALTGGRGQGSVLHQRRALEAMAAREGEVGSPMGQVYSAVCLAWADVLAGRGDHAEGLAVADPPETTLEPWVEALYHYVLAEHHRVAGRGDTALQILAKARSIDDLSPPARALLAVARARAHIAVGEVDRADQDLDGVAGMGGGLGAQAAVIRLLAALGGPVDDLELAVWRVHRHVGGPWLDPADAVVALSRGATALSAAGRTRAADGARRAAAGIAAGTVARLTPEDRAGFTARLAQG